MDLSQVKVTLKELLTQSIPNTIKGLKNLLAPASPRYNELILIEGRNSEVDTQRLLDIISNEDMQVAYNKIRFALISLIDNVADEDVKPTTPEPAASAPSQRKVGSVLYQIPGAMQLNKMTRCTVKISWDKELLEGLIADRDSKLQAIQVSSVMQVELTDFSGEDAFKIMSINQNEQFIDEGMVTSWMFNVKPQLEGIYTLTLKVAVIEPINGKERKREIVLEESVEIVTLLQELTPADVGFKKKEDLKPAMMMSFLPIVMPNVPDASESEPDPEPELEPEVVKPQPTRTKPTHSKPTSSKPGAGKAIGFVGTVVAIIIALLWWDPLGIGLLQGGVQGPSGPIANIDPIAIPTDSLNGPVAVVETPDTTPIVTDTLTADTLGEVVIEENPEDTVATSVEEDPEIIDEIQNDPIEEEPDDRIGQIPDDDPIDTPPDDPVVDAPEPKPFEYLYVNDSEGNRYRALEMDDGLTWTVQNLQVDVGEGSTCYKDNPANCRQYGRLYTWSAANEACSKLEGGNWRVPTDQEWHKMIRKYGGYLDYMEQKRRGNPKKGFRALVDKNESGFEVSISGYGIKSGTSTNYYAVNKEGYYWTSTEMGLNAWAFLFNARGAERDQLEKRIKSKSNSLSCRCVQQ